MVSIAVSNRKRQTGKQSVSRWFFNRYPTRRGWNAQLIIALLVCWWLLPAEPLHAPPAAAAQGHGRRRRGEPAAGAVGGQTAQPAAGGGALRAAGRGMSPSQSSAQSPSHQSITVSLTASQSLLSVLCSVAFSPVDHCVSPTASQSLLSVVCLVPHHVDALLLWFWSRRRWPRWTPTTCTA